MNSGVGANTWRNDEFLQEINTPTRMTQIQHIFNSQSTSDVTSFCQLVLRYLENWAGISILFAMHAIDALEIAKGNAYPKISVKPSG